VCNRCWVLNYNLATRSTCNVRFTLSWQYWVLLYSCSGDIAGYNVTSLIGDVLVRHSICRDIVCIHALCIDNCATLTRISAMLWQTAVWRIQTHLRQSRNCMWHQGNETLYIRVYSIMARKHANYEGVSIVWLLSHYSRNRPITRSHRNKPCRCVTPEFQKVNTPDVSLECSFRELCPVRSCISLMCQRYLNHGLYNAQSLLQTLINIRHV
jgi:hypothetical protein